MQPSSENTDGRRSWIALVAIGVVGGVLSGALGVGGGILMIPLLIGLVGMDGRQASATSLAAIVPTSLAGSVAYLARGEADLLLAAVIAVGSVGGSFLGTWLLRRIPLAWLRWLFIALMLGVAARLLLSVPERGAQLDLTPATGVALVVVGVLMGVTAGLFGIGGGLVLVPALVLGFGMSDLLAKGTSLVVMLPTATMGTVIHARNRVLDLRAGVTVGLAATASSFLGVALAFAVPPRTSAVVFAALVLLAAGQLTVRAVREHRGR